MKNISLKIRYIVWGLLLFTAVYIFFADANPLLAMGISIPIEVLGIILSLLILFAAYFLRLSNYHFRSCLWAITVLSTYSVVSLLLFYWLGRRLGLTVTIVFYVVYLFFHYWVWYGRRKNLSKDKVNQQN